MAIDTLKSLYIHELQDLYSGNSQMQEVVTQLKSAAHNADLSTMLEDSIDYLGKHNETLKSLIEAQGERANAEYCKGMQGLVKEAKAHALEQDFTHDALQDAAIISQMQRMSHYGLAGYGTAKALAKAAGLKDDLNRIEATLEETYDGDRFLSRIAETEVNKAAA